MRRTSKKMFPPLPSTVCRLTVFFLSVASVAQAQIRGAELLREQKPTYPEDLHKGQIQGNVILIARIDRNGLVQDARPIWTSHEKFVPSTLTAVKAWVFRPALREGRPIEIAANIVFPFRIRDEKGREVGRGISGPALGELAIFPADATGRRSAPEGFPIRKGVDQRMRVESSLDLPPAAAARRLVFRAEVLSPSGRRLQVFQESLPVAARATQVKRVFSAPIGADWEDGIWRIRFTVDGVDAGAGQFWLARDAARFDFARALRKLKE